MPSAVLLPSHSIPCGKSVGRGLRRGAKLGSNRATVGFFRAGGSGNCEWRIRLSSSRNGASGSKIVSGFSE